MGTQLIFVGRRLEARPSSSAVTLSIVAGGRRAVWYACRLKLDRGAPLTSTADFFLDLARGRDEVVLGPGAWEVGLPPAFHVWVEGGSARVVSRAELFHRLGAGAVLSSLGLEDAAVSLAQGDYDFAANQWLVERARRNAPG